MKQLILLMMAVVLVGCATAQRYTGSMYGFGVGVKKNPQKAFKWYQKAADKGEPTAQSNLGVMYFNSEGVEQNDVTAYVWWDIAATNGDEDAKKNKGTIAKQMTAEQITKAEVLVKEMIKKNPKLIQKQD